MSRASRWPLIAAILVLCCAAPSLAADDGPLVSADLPPDVQDILVLGPSRPVLLRLRITIDGQPFREVWEARFDEVFAFEDRDEDGRLNLAEARVVVRDMNGGLRDTAFNIEDALTDGSIDRAALRAYIEQSLPPFVLRPRQVIGQGSALALLPLLDTDGDRRLSAGELAAAEAQLLQRDFDDNGVMTPGELILDPQAIAAASDPDAGEADLDPDKSMVLVLTRALSRSHFAMRMVDAYDRERDGRLVLSGREMEIRLPPAASNQWDADGDGALSFEELAQAELWPPDMELSFAMGKASVRGVRSGRAPRSPEGFRARKKLLGGYQLDLGEAEIDFDRDNRDPRQADLVRMADYDRDNNQYLDEAEAVANNFGPQTFAAMDVDRDGKVFKGELTSFMTRQNEAASARLYLVVKDKGQDLFEMLEIETDGLLSSRELRSAKNVLDISDTSGDGQLGHDEIPQQLEFELVRGVDERVGPETFYRFTTLAGGDSSSGSGPLWFQKMDRNQDGDVSPREFLGPHTTFERLDADGDGLIDRSEAEAAAIEM